MKTLTYWDKLSCEKRPIILYGTGNGADKIIDACEKYSIRIDAVFASNGFVRNRVFRDMPVRSYDDIVSEYGNDIIILPAFGTSVPEVMEYFKTLSERHTVIIPEVPLYGGGIFDAVYLEEHREDLEYVYSLLADDMSRKLFEDAIRFRITGDVKFLSLCESMEDSMRSIPGFADVEFALDGGAFKGDSATDMLSALPNIKHIIACEPDPKTFKKLELFTQSDIARGIVLPVETALNDTVGFTESVTSGSRGSGITGKNRRAKVSEVRLDTIDNIIGESRIDYIKLDVEGFEKEAIIGASDTLERESPILSVSVYHRTDDIWYIPRLVREKLGEYKLYVRRPECIPMWDLNMYFIPKVAEHNNS